MPGALSIRRIGRASVTAAVAAAATVVGVHLGVGGPGVSPVVRPPAAVTDVRAGAIDGR